MRALLIHNIDSGGQHRRDEVAAAASRLSAAGWRADLLTSGKIDELSAGAREAVDSGVDMLVVAGGDGTINVAAQYLAHRDTVLGILPCGTANVWAKEFGIPLNLSKATDVLLNGEVAQVDLGRANGRYFLFIASVGFDALVARGVRTQDKRRLGKAAYVLAALAKALELRGEEVTMRVDGRVLRRRVLMVAASNLRQYGGVVEIAPEAFADDGLLDVSIFRGQDLFAALRHAIRVLLRRHRQNAEAELLRAREIQIEARNSLPLELDGDYVGTTPVTICVDPGALRAIVPPGSRAPLSRNT